ncbi:hypothetical protein GCM10027566_20720 [Arachidicoccus ginsenosidivorans]
MTAGRLCAQQHQAARYEIDAERMDAQLTDDDALTKGKAFQKMDSTYYVGYLYEGYFKYNHSADYLGYKNAIPTLEKARELIEKQYNPQFKRLFTSLEYLTRYYDRFQDYYTICNALKECYDNIEMPDSVMSLLNHLASYNFKKDFFGIYYHRAWTYHRNRIFTSATHPFLKNSVKENEQMAFKYCYDGLNFIHKNQRINDEWFGPDQALADELQIYHYLALLHCYNKNYDSCFHYYQILAKYGMISWNNYAGFQAEIGNFKNAQQFFQRDLSISYSGENVLKEPYYYLPELYVYAGRSKDAITMCDQIIQQNGSRPGFGWYNLALCRSFIYDAQLDSAQYALNKAAEFKELHIGTTLTQEQYEFTINLLRVNLLDHQIEEIKFLNKGWWYSPTTLYRLGQLKAKKLMAAYNVCINLAYNPDRFRMVYDLFCSEATTTFDEGWYLMKDFSPKYFAEKYHDYQQTDKRKNIQRYFKLFEAKFDIQGGQYTKARTILENLIQTTKLDTQNEKLFLGRLYEAIAKVYDKVENKGNRDFYNNMLYTTYPQLVPFSGLKMRFNLKITGKSDHTIRKILDDLNDLNIKWVFNQQVPTVTLNFEKRGEKYQATINVTSVDGKVIVDQAGLIFQRPEGVAGELGLRIFNKGGSLVYNRIMTD